MTFVLTLTETAVLFFSGIIYPLEEFCHQNSEIRNPKQEIHGAKISCSHDKKKKNSARTIVLPTLLGGLYLEHVIARELSSEG